jgi:hypothetical protein
MGLSIREDWMPEKLTLSQDWLYDSIESSVVRLQELKILKSKDVDETKVLLDQIANLIHVQFPRRKL